MDPVALRAALAVEAILQEHTFSAPPALPQVMRSYVPVYAQEQIDGLRITVMPGSQEQQRDTRAADILEARVLVAVQKKVSDGSDVAEVDAMLGFVEQVRALLSRRDLEMAAYMGIDWDPLYSPAHLRRFRLFTAILQVTYRSASA